MENPRFWRLKKEYYRLIGEVCNSCENKIFPPRDVCPHCGNNAKHQFEFSGKGEVYSFTKLHEPPKGFEDQRPYTVALIKLAEGPLVTAQLTDIDNEPYIGMPVEMITRKIKEDGPQGMIVYGYKFRPELQASPDGNL